MVAGTGDTQCFHGNRGYPAKKVFSCVNKAIVVLRTGYIVDFCKGRLVGIFYSILFYLLYLYFKLELDFIS